MVKVSKLMSMQLTLNRQQKNCISLCRPASPIEKECKKPKIMSCSHIDDMAECIKVLYR